MQYDIDDATAMSGLLGSDSGGTSRSIEQSNLPANIAGSINNSLRQSFE